jgi:ABC-2 type transport system ATP-binding protein
MISLHDVHLQRGQRPVLRGLQLDVPPGRIFGLLGPNGAGKTTTLNLILGFLRPDTGTVRVHDQDPAAHTSRTRDLTAYLPENVALYPELSGEENLAYFSTLGGHRLTPAQTGSLLDRVGLAHEARTRRIHTYSKGMRQRVALALALAKNARVFLLDEPTTGLDPAAVQDLARLLRSLASAGASILLTTHDLWHLSLDCDEVGILRDGILSDRFPATSVTPGELAKRYLATR